MFAVNSAYYDDPLKFSNNVHTDLWYEQCIAIIQRSS